MVPLDSGARGGLRASQSAFDSTASSLTLEQCALTEMFALLYVQTTESQFNQHLLSCLMVQSYGVLTHPARVCGWVKMKAEPDVDILP